MKKYSFIILLVGVWGCSCDATTSELDGND